MDKSNSYLASSVKPSFTIGITRVAPNWRATITASAIWQSAEPNQYRLIGYAENLVDHYEIKKRR